MHSNNSGSFQGGGRYSSLAIVGIGCRFPGGADDVELFWDMLVSGRSGIRETPSTRWDIHRFYDPDPSIPGMVISKWGGFVENIDKFDARFWGLSPREAMRMDPQQRWLLEVAWEALEDSGTPPQKIRGSKTGVFVGIASNDYSWLQMPYHEEIDVYTNSGNTASIASNRISYLLDLKGPSSSVDTACSSALVAVWAACHSIWRGNCEAALAGGVNALLVPHGSIGFSRASMLSPSGQCYAFDSRANGYVRAEGAGMVYVKPLTQALADGDRIYATIRAAVCNQDGHTSSMTVPGVEGQSAMLREAYREAGVAPGRVAYMEAHGTGTPVGDPIEATALGRVLNEGRSRSRKCLIGSVKTNIGHLEAGSGLPGLIKAALVLHKDTVPPCCNFEQPNPNIPFDALGLKVADRLQPLPHFDDQPPIAGVNSFGFGGTNAHVVLEAAPAAAVSAHPATSDALLADRPMLLPISARDEAALKNYVQSFHDLLLEPDANLADIGYSAGTRKDHHAQRLVFSARSREQMLESLATWLRDPSRATDVVSGKGKTTAAPLVFVFTGQGAQWWAMGRELLNREPLFRETIQSIDKHFVPLAGWSILDEMQRDEATSRIDQTNVAQPAIFAVQVALAELWKSWGVQPDKVIGHSVGEVAAAYCAGIYSLEDAAKVIFHRSRLQNTTGGHGRMLALGVSPTEARQWISKSSDRVQIAVFNSSNLVTLAGDTEPLEHIAEQLQQAGKFVRWLRINYAFHTHQMDPIRGELLEVLADIKPRTAQIPFFSTVTGGYLSGEKLDALYWWRNVRQPVLFGPAIARLVESGDLNFLEIGPHPALASSLNEYLSTAGRSGGVFHSLKRKADDSIELMRNAANLHLHGVELDWKAINQSSGNWVRLPRYPWSRETFWLESKECANDRMGRVAHPLLGMRTPAPQPTWRFKLHPGRYAYLKDHSFWDSIVFPGAGFGEMGIALARLLFPDEPHAVEDLEIKKALFISADQPPTIQIEFNPTEKTYFVFSRVGEKEDWDLHAHGKLMRVSPSRPANVDVGTLRQGLDDFIDHERYYAEFAAAGYQFGPNFSQIQNVWRKQGEALAEIVVPENIAATMGEYHIHPSVLDACFHIFKGVQYAHEGAVPEDFFYLPHSFRRIRLYCDKPPARFWAHAHLTQDDGKSLVCDIRAYDDAGNPLADIVGFRADHVEQKRSGDDIENCFYQFRWEPRRLRGRGVESPYPFAPVNQVVEEAQRALPGLHYERELDKYQADYRPRIEAVADQFTQNAWLELGWQPQIGDRFTFTEIVSKLGIIDAYHRLAKSHLRSLEQRGRLQATGDESWQIVQLPVHRDVTSELEALQAEYPRFVTETLLHERTGPRLADVMSGRVDPVQVLFPGGSSELLEKFYSEGYDFAVLHELMRLAVAQAIAAKPQRRALRILEVGAGTGGLTHAILPVLPPDQTEYAFTDVGPSLLNAAKNRFSDYKFIDYHTFDLEKDPQSQGFAAGGFDLILATDVLHATRDLRETLGHLRSCLADGGLFVFLEVTTNRSGWNNIFGLLSGWWRFTDTQLRKDSAILSVPQWEKLLGECGFTDVSSFSSMLDPRHDEQSVFVAAVPRGAAAAPSAEAKPITSGYVLFADEQGVARGLAERLRKRGFGACLVVPGEQFRQSADDTFIVRPSSTEDMRQVLGQAAATWGSVAGLVHGWCLDQPQAKQLDTDQLKRTQQLSVLNGLRLFQADSALPPRMWVLTRNAQFVQEGDSVDGIASSPMVGLIRVANNELANCQQVLVDVDSVGEGEVIDDLLHEIVAGDNEYEVAYRRGRRFAVRFHRLRTEEFPRRIRNAVQPDGSVIPYRVQTDRPGILTNLTLNETVRREPGPMEVEVRVRAGGINFRDVMKALGTYPGNPVDVLWFGDDFSGVVERVGSEVKNLRVGDRVAGMAPYAFRAYATVDSRMVFQTPKHISFEQAATLPTVFLTAHYALCHLARMQPGEKVLIHAGTGGVGQAAIQIAKRLGLEIFATAGSDEKRRLLKEMGVHHVMNSRTLDFADQIRDITGGRGVDAVLNSLAGDFIPKSFSVLAPFGRFLEIGKIDIYRNTKIGLEQLRNNISYFIIDLAQHLMYQQQFVAQMFGELAERFAAGDYEPLPFSVFPITQLPEAFRFMAQGKHVGKNVLAFDQPEIPIGPCTEDAHRFRTEATYLITGGAGGFGLAMARWMTKHGARHLALMSRSGPRDEESIRIIGELQAAGVQILDARGDVTSAADVQRVVDQIRDSMPPLKGVVHGAMVLDDEFLSALDEERFNKALDPKMLGAWNLHCATLACELDHFVCLSSFSTVVGGPRQANYNAGNFLLEALAQYRHAHGLPAQAIGWGALLGAGFVERNQKTAQYLEKVGMKAFRIDEALRAFGQLSLYDPVRVAVCRADWRAFAKSSATVGKSPTFAAVSQEKQEADGGGNFAARLAATAPDARAGLIENFMIAQVASVFGADVSKIDGDAPLTSLGLDSLMAVELTNRIERDLGASIPMGSLLNGPSIKDLAQIVLRILEPTLATDVEKGSVQTSSSGPAPLTKSTAVVTEFPLSASQQWIWHRLHASKKGIHNPAFCVKFTTELDVDALHHAFTTMVHRHPMLNVVFDEQEHTVVQKQRTGVIPEFQELDLADYQADQIRAIVGEHAGRPFQIAHGPVIRLILFRTANDTHILLLAAHALVADQRSVTMLAQELLDSYQAILAKEPLERDSSDFTYHDYVVWQQQLLSNDEAKADEFWKKHLHDASAHIDLLSNRSRNGSAATEGATFGFTMDEGLSHRLLATAAEQNVSLDCMLLTALGTLLHRTSHQDDLLIGTTVDGRQHRELNGVIGSFANPVVVRSQSIDDPTLGETLQRNKQQLAMLAEHQNVPFSHSMFEGAENGKAGSTPRLQAFFHMDRDVAKDDQGFAACSLGQGGHSIRTGKLQAEGIDFVRSEADCELELRVEEAGGIIRGCWQYQRGILDSAMIQQLQQRLMEILQQLVRDPAQRLSQISLTDIRTTVPTTTTPTSSGTGTKIRTSVRRKSGSVDFLAEAKLDPAIVPPADRSFDPSKLDHVFLSGATGFLGAFLLDDLLRMTNATIHCLVRASTPDKARQRIVDNLKRYELSPPEVAQRVVPVTGDLGQKRFGLSEKEFDRLANEMDALYHNGAIVNLVYPYTLLKAANVRGTEEILRLAAKSRLKPTHHVSTFWVQAADDGRAREVVTEDDPLPPCEGLPIGYSRSKWVGEQMIAHARERGLPVSIYRPGYVTGDSRTGACNADDFLHALMLACNQVRAIPILDMNLEITPVDFVSRAIVQLSLQPQHLGNTYHLVNPHPLPLSTLADWMQASGLNVRPVPYSIWKAKLADLANGAPDALIAPLMTLLGDGVNAGWHPRYDCRRATAHLAESHIICPPADSQLLTTYHAFLDRAGLLWEGPPLKRTAPTTRDAVRT